MTVLECPLCCAENFPDEYSLQNHLLNLSDNIVCPVCEVQFKTIRCLAFHLGGECRQLSSESCAEENVGAKLQSEELASEQSNQTEPLSETIVLDNEKDGENLEQVLALDDSNKSRDFSDIKSLQLIVESEEVSENCIEIDDNGEDDRNRDSDVKDKQSDDIIDEGTIDESVINESTVNEITIDESSINESKLYSCSVCNITFTSVEDHLRDFHRDEQVFVDRDETEEYELLDKTLAEDPEKMDTTEISHVPENYSTISEDMLSDESSIIWSQDDFKNIMLGSWTVDEPLSGQNMKVQSSKRGYVLMPQLENANEGQWVGTTEGFFYALTDVKARILRTRDDYVETSDLETAVKTITDEDTANSVGNFVGSNDDLWDDWPEEIRHLPLATFVTIGLPNPLQDNTGYTIVNKTYAFRDHKVRVVSVKGGTDGVPSLEDVPFPERPPDGIIPVLEPALDTPSDLFGTFAVMWACHLCGYLELDWSSLEKHQCLTSDNVNSHQCAICSQTFHSKRSVINHYNQIHKGQEIVRGKIECEICFAKVQTASHLEKHMAMHRKNDLMKCDVCKCMVQKTSIDRHLRAHEKDGQLRLVCRLCNRPFKGESELKLHIPQCHLQDKDWSDYQCEYCQKGYPDLNELREHLVSHNIPIRLHCCQYCPKSFSRLIDKVVHERVHTKSKPHECKECGRCFRLRNSLMTHMRIHTGERPYACPVCHKCFRTKYLVQTHAAVHSKNMQYKCSHCPKVFKCKERFKLHENFHLRPYTCEQCGRNFHSMGFMRKHVENHKKGSLLYTCSLCPHMFTRAAYLENHLETEHGLDSATSISISCQKTFEHMDMKAKMNAQTAVSSENQ